MKDKVRKTLLKCVFICRPNLILPTLNASFYASEIYVHSFQESWFYVMHSIV